MSNAESILWRVIAELQESEKIRRILGNNVAADRTGQLIRDLETVLTEIEQMRAEGQG